MREITDSDRTIVDRVLRFDYQGGHDFSRLHSAEKDALFYGIKRGTMGLITCLGIISEKQVGYLGIDHGNGGYIDKRYVIPITDLMNYREPQEISQNKTKVPSPRMSNTNQLRETLDRYQTLLRLFSPNYESWHRFSKKLRKNKEYREKYKYPLERDLKIIDLEITKGAEALLNEESEEPLHDFLMVVDSLYRRTITKTGRP